MSLPQPHAVLGDLVAQGVYLLDWAGRFEEKTDYAECMRRNALRLVTPYELRVMALEFRECIAEDVKPGKLTSFPQSVNLEADETVVFSWIMYESRAHRDEVNDKVMKDPRMADMIKPESMPFDGKRMIYGGFEMLIDL